MESTWITGQTSDETGASFRVKCGPLDHENERLQGRGMPIAERGSHRRTKLWMPSLIAMTATETLDCWHSSTIWDLKVSGRNYVGP